MLARLHRHKAPTQFKPDERRRATFAGASDRVGARRGAHPIVVRGRACLLKHGLGVSVRVGVGGGV